jgi:hypothetical protein
LAVLPSINSASFFIYSNASTLNRFKTGPGFFKLFFCRNPISNKNLTNCSYENSKRLALGSRVRWGQPLRLYCQIGIWVGLNREKGGNVISRECRFLDFIGAVRNKGYFEILDMANREATEAERIMLRRRVDERIRQRCGKEYAERIKQLISYMRYEVKPRGQFGRDAEVLETAKTERRPRRGV